MATISLRSYNKEIEHLIDQGQVDEAIGHCMHILQSVPKHLGTYRLLGKALLESKRFSDATDIFQRILSSVPDDFVSNVGMSIIRENEENLDMAIWHMERAFESQPANAVVQDELRRLHGKRDGAEPPKIRLTRGALARMYARGHLYRQAIGELRAALAEDPQRPDLQVLLAEMYYQNGQRVEAVDTCSTLLKKYPFCLEANRILTAILPETERKDDAVVYLQRVISLDPYYGKLADGQTSSDQVPDQAITVEKLSYQPGQNMLQASSQPDWAASLGAAFETPKVSDVLPDWLTSEGGSMVSEETGPTPVSSKTPEDIQTVEEKEESLPDWFSQGPISVDAAVAEPPAENIPEFLKEAGWGPSSGEFDEESAANEQQGEEALAEDITKAEIPDWLQQMAPAEEEQATPAELEATGDVPPWLQETPPGSTDTIISWLKAIPQEDIQEPEEAGEDIEVPEKTGEEWTESEEVQLPDWLNEQNQQPTGVTGTLPSWLPESETPVVAESESATAGGPDAEIPDWLQGIEDEINPPAVQAELESVEFTTAEETFESTAEDHLPDLAEPVVEGDQTVPEPLAKDELSEWLKSLESSSDLEETPAEEPPLTWEAAIAKVTGMEEAPIEPSMTENVPEWLEPVELAQGFDKIEDLGTEIAGGEEVFAPEIPVETLPEAEEPVPGEFTAEEAPDWLRDLEMVKPVEEGTPLEEAPAWLDETVSPTLEAPSEIPLPDWLSEIETAPVTAEETTPVVADSLEDTKPRVIKLPPEPTFEPIAPTVAPATEAAFNLEDPDAALAWLESLAAQQGIPQDQLTTSPEERPVTPDWLEQAGQEAEARGELSTYVPTETTLPLETPIEPAVPIAEQPTLITPIKTSFPEIPEPESKPAEEIPDWLLGIETSPVAAEETMPAVIEEPVEMLEKDLGEEFAEHFVEPVIEEPAPAVFEEVDTGYPGEPVLDQSPQPVSEEPAPEAAFNLDDPDAALAWLESLAAQQGIPQDQLTTAPEERPATPDWLEQAGQEAEARGDLSQYVPTETTQAFPLPVETSETAMEAPIQEEAEQALVGEPEQLEDMPDWLRALEEPGEPLPVTPTEVENPELAPDWMEEFRTVTEPTDSLQAPEVTVAEPASEEELPSWLQEEPSEEEAAPASINEPPTWISEEQPQENIPWTQEPTLEGEPDAMPDWLKSTQKLDLNAASLRDLENLPGMGFILAQTIMAYRETNGPFTDVEELIAVPGMDDPLLDQIKDLLEVKSSAPQTLSVADRIVEPKGDDEKHLMEARRMLVEKEYADASDQLLGLIKKHLYLSEIIRDVQETINTVPDNIFLWQTLGDAYMHNDQLQEALNAYSKAELLLR